MAVVVALASRQLVYQENALDHGLHIAKTHQRAGNPDLGVQGDPVGGGKSLQLGADAVAPAEAVQVHRLVGGRLEADRVDHAGPAAAGQFIGRAVGLVEGAEIVQGGYLEKLYPQGLDNGPGILVQDAFGAARELDAVAVHHEGGGRTVHIGAVKTVEGLARDPAGITAVCNNPGIGAALGAQAQGLPHGHGNHHPEAPAVELGAAR